MTRKRNDRTGGRWLGFISVMLLAAIGLWMVQFAMQSVKRVSLSEHPQAAAQPRSTSTGPTAAQRQRLAEMALARQHEDSSTQARADVAQAPELSPEQLAQQAQLDRQNAQARLEIEQAKLAQALVAAYPDVGSRASAPDARRARCEATRQYRETVLKQAGLNRTFDLLRQLDDQVYGACKGL